MITKNDTYKCDFCDAENGEFNFESGNHVACEKLSVENAALRARCAELEAEAAQSYEAIKAIKGACLADGFVRMEGDLIGQIIFGSAVEQCEAAIKAHETAAALRSK